jgi:penicillin-binding protein 2
MSLQPARPPETRIPVSPQIALRVAALGTFALVMFGIIFFRLWYLQILTGSQYVKQVGEQQTRSLPIPAPRGELLDRYGRKLVSSRTTNAVQVVPSELPPGITEQVVLYRKALAASAGRIEAAKARLRSFEATYADRRRLPAALAQERARLHRQATATPQAQVSRLPARYRRLHALFRRLGGVLGLPARQIDEAVVQGVYVTPYAPVTIDASAGPGAMVILGERQNEFPAVLQRPVAVRDYPFGEMGAQMIGHVGPVTKEELSREAFRGVKEGAVVGQNGVEYYYDKYLRGTPGYEKVKVNAAGEPVASKLPEVQPQAGYDLKLTIDASLQLEAEKALREELAAAQGRGKAADGAAFVAMDPENGQILAIGSYPSYDPGFFTKPFTSAQYDSVFQPPSNGVTGGDPLLDRATEGGYPTGSTFKPITAMGALEAGVITPSEGLGAGQCISVSTEQFCNAGHAEYGSADLVHALEVSSDTYFFTVGERANSRGPVIQRMARRLGIGDPTGIDLPSEAEGVVPDAAWLAKLNEKEARCTRREHGKPCYYVAEPGHEWSVGDNMHLAVGQGDLLTDPLQMALAYSTLVNAYRHGGEGWRPTPHLGFEIDNSAGELVQTLRFPPAKRHIELNPTYLGDVFEGIHDATTGPGGTSADVWAGWNQSLHPTYGKTGTAERLGQTEQAWYMCYVASVKRPIVISVTVEQGGFGDESAAPVARLIASQWFNQRKRLVTGKSPDH